MVTARNIKISAGDNLTVFAGVVHPAEVPARRGAGRRSEVVFARKRSSRHSKLGFGVGVRRARTRRPATAVSTPLGLDAFTLGSMGRSRRRGSGTSQFRFVQWICAVGKAFWA